MTFLYTLRFVCKRSLYYSHQYDQPISIDIHYYCIPLNAVFLHISVGLAIDHLILWTRWQSFPLLSSAERTTRCTHTITMITSPTTMTKCWKKNRPPVSSFIHWSHSVCTNCYEILRIFINAASLLRTKFLAAQDGIVLTHYRHTSVPNHHEIWPVITIVITIAVVYWYSSHNIYSILGSWYAEIRPHSRFGLESWRHWQNKRHFL